MYVLLACLYVDSVLIRWISQGNAAASSSGPGDAAARREQEQADAEDDDEEDDAKQPGILSRFVEAIGGSAPSSPQQKHD